MLLSNKFKILASYVTTHFDFRMSIVCLKIRSSLSSAIYSKLLRVSSSDFASKLNSGEVLNFMSTDVDRIVNACPSFHSFWSCPLQVCFSLFKKFNLVSFLIVGYPPRSFKISKDIELLVSCFFDV